MGMGNTLVAFKTNDQALLLNQFPNILFLAKLKEKKGLFAMEKHRLICYNWGCVHHPIPTRENREHPGNFQNKSLSSAFN